MTSWTSVSTSVRPPLHVCQYDQYHASLQHTSLILDIHLLINWHLSKQGIRWPVSHDHIAGSSLRSPRSAVFFFFLTELTEQNVMWSARFLSHMNHVSVSPTDGNGPTQGQRKTLTRVGIEPTIFGLDLRRSTDWATRSDGSRPWELKMLKSRQWTCTSTRKGYGYTNVGRVALIY